MKLTAPAMLPHHLAPMKGTVYRWLALGLLVRLIISPLFASPDLASLGWVNLILLFRHQLVSGADPPLIFFIMSGLYSVLTPILPTDIVNTLTSGSTAFTPVTPIYYYGVLPDVERYILILKAPYLIFDLLVALTVIRLVDDPSTALAAFKLWVFNPFSIYITYVIGQYDIVMVAPLMLALLFVKRRQETPASLSLGIAGAIKGIGLPLFLPLLIIWSRSWTGSKLSKGRRLIWLLLVGLLPLALTITLASQFPKFYESANLALRPGSSDLNGFFGSSFYSRGIPADPLSLGFFRFILDYSLHAQTLSQFVDTIYLLPMLYGLFLLAVIYFKGWTFTRIWKSLSVFLLLYYSFALFHVQWFLWVQPFLALLIAIDRRQFFSLYRLLIPLYFVYNWYWGQALTTYLLFPIIPQAAFLPDPISIMNAIGLDGVKIVNLVRSLFSAVCVFMALLILRSELQLELNWRRNKEDTDIQRSVSLTGLGGPKAGTNASSLYDA